MNTDTYKPPYGAWNPVLPTKNAVSTDVQD